LFNQVVDFAKLLDYSLDGAKDLFC
jgi:hypothetical protein